ncbi:MAG: zinc-dependent metalloprotease [Bdellovibrionota bacterium]
MKVFFYLSGTLCVLAGMLAGCAQSNSTFESKPAVRAADSIGSSFQVVEKFSSRPVITIQRSALDKEFLLQANLIDQTTAAMGNGLKSRIVAFKKQDDQLFMLEAVQGHVISYDLPSNLVLAMFPIVSETEQTITFDFNAGMTRLFTQDEWRASDRTGTEYKADFASALVPVSYLESAKVDANNQLTIRQVAQITKSITGTQLVEVRYFLSPYRPDADYVAKKTPGFNKVGYFEVAPQITSSGAGVVYATKHQHLKPIVFAISSNTPKEYRQAVEEGILYWNRAFWNNPISVVDAPEGVTAPDANYNVIQWVNHDRAGFAYADAQMDPRTGQVMHAQAFLTSTFAFSGRVRARQLLKRIRSHESAHEHGKEGAIGLRGFGSSPLCDFGSHKGQQELAASLEQLLASNVGEADFLRVSQDYVRMVVAHEVGHLMGLRHNFAGSLHTKNYPINERTNLMKRYLGEKTVPADVQVSSSVMDYLPFQEDVLAGHMIAHTKEILDYDRKAIEILYGDRDIPASEVPLFCTDSNVGSFVDCNRFDYGSSIVEYGTSSTQVAIDGLPYALLEKFIAAVAPLAGATPAEVDTVSFTPSSVADDLLGVRAELVGNFDSSSHFLSIYRSFPFVSVLNIEAVKEKEGEYLIKEVDRVGGLEKVFSQINSNFYQETLEKFEKLARSEEYVKGTGLAGQPYEFSNAEIETMTATVKLLLDKLPKALTEKDLEILGEIPDAWKNLDHSLGAGLGKLLASRTREYVLQTTGDVVEVTATVPLPKPAPAPADKAKEEEKEDEAGEFGDGLEEEAPMAEAEPATKTITMRLPTFFYELKSREKAAELLESDEDQKSIDWGFEERKEIKEAFVKLLDDACGCDFASTSPSKLTVTEEKQKRAVTKWFLENKKVLGKIK